MSAISFSAWPVGTDTEIDWKAYMQQVETVLQVGEDLSISTWRLHSTLLVFSLDLMAIGWRIFVFFSTDPILCVSNLQGETDYKEISGQTGPLVYPAGFVHVFTAMYWVTDGGNIARAQVPVVHTFW